jgi:hypothetical protein
MTLTGSVRATHPNLCRDFVSVGLHRGCDAVNTGAYLIRHGRHCDKKHIYSYDKAYEQPITAVSLGFMNQQGEGE